MPVEGMFFQETAGYTVRPVQGGAENTGACPGVLMESSAPFRAEQKTPRSVSWCFDGKLRPAQGGAEGTEERVLAF